MKAVGIVCDGDMILISYCSLSHDIVMLVVNCCSHGAMVKLLSITQRTNGDDEMWNRHFKAVFLILIDLMKDEDVSCTN